MRSSSPRRNSSATPSCSSSSSEDSSEGPPRGAAEVARTRTIAGCAASPRNPERPSWTISTCASCSLMPSSARAASMASSTLAALLSISAIVSSASSRLRGAARPALPPGGGPARGPAPARPRPWPSRPGLRGLARSAVRSPAPLRRRRPLRHGRLGEHEMLLTDLDRVRGSPVHDEPRRDLVGQVVRDAAAGGGDPLPVLDDHALHGVRRPGRHAD